MTDEISPPNDDMVDDDVDEEIHRCLNLKTPQSFFLYAGAGSGKTRSLVKALDKIRSESRRYLTLHGQRIGVITYTKAACDEIKERTEFDSLIEVSTIHSFSWDLIKPYHFDIREWLRQNLEQEISDLEDKQLKGRPNTKASIDRENKIISKKARLENLRSVKRFTYNPNSDNYGKDALNHSEVISITSSFLNNKTTLQEMLIGKFPILLIDESQDTMAELMDALLVVQGKYRTRFCLGLFGDTMQRIYGHGKVNLENCIPPDWARPAKKMNHRCSGRIIRLINRIRSEVDDQEQQGRSDKSDGVVRFFIVPNENSGKSEIEAEIMRRMGEVSRNPDWKPDKTLTLEHHMAARRIGFFELFAPLYAVDRFRTGLLDGTLPGLRFFTQYILPLVRSMRAGDRFGAAAVVRKSSPLLDSRRLRNLTGFDQKKSLETAKKASDALLSLWENQTSPTLLDVLNTVATSGLFVIPEILEPIAKRQDSESFQDAESEDEEDGDAALEAWDAVMMCSFEQVEKYDQYISGNSVFDTHQGVKGLEFQKVIVVVDDEEAKGFLFSYDKLFGVKKRTETDIKNEREGKDTSIDRTRRLFYVTCSRAEENLAIVAYSSNPKMLKEQVINRQWFEDSEVEIVSATRQ